MCEERGGQPAHKLKERKNPPAFEREGLVSSSGVGAGIQRWHWHPALASGVGVGVATSLSLVLVTWRHCLMLVMGWRLVVVTWHVLALAVGIGVAASLVLQLAVDGCDMAWRCHCCCCCRVVGVASGCW